MEEEFEIKVSSDLQKIKGWAREIADMCKFDDIKIEAPGGFVVSAGKRRFEVAANENLIEKLDNFGENLY